ncbi:alpha/beta hydrolase [beta proteobacterium AAP99]|nr:alpha/beta hydrolase [beta proteobacterium AAP99]
MKVRANGIELEAEIDGPVDGTPVLLIMGLGMQLTAWPPALVNSLVDHGCRVIRFDNRDIGLSQRFDHLPTPAIGWSAVRHALGLKVSAPYTLDDMAADTLGLLDALSIERAHVCGASMGGMIAQLLAARHPQRVKHLALMLTTSGARGLPGPTLKARAALLARPRGRGEDAMVAHGVKVLSAIASPGYPPQPADLEERVRAAYHRSFRPRGFTRQLLAIAASADRSPLLAQIQAPTRILHGSADPLVPAACARDLAAKIPRARLSVFDGMGHDLPVALVPRFVAPILGK